MLISEIILDDKIIDKIVSDCIKKYDSVNEISFNNLVEVSQKIDIYHNYGIIYFLLLDGELKYIGKSRGRYFRQRMKSHFFDASKGTSSKYDFISKSKGKTTLKFLKIKPESLRNLIEEILISKFDIKNGWNYKKFKQ